MDSQKDFKKKLNLYGLYAMIKTSISDRQQRHVLAPQDPQLNELLPAGPPFEEGTEALPNQLVLIYHSRLALGWGCNMVTDIIV